MAGDIELKLRLMLDGKEVVTGVEMSREQLKKLANDARQAATATSGAFSKASDGVRSSSETLSRVQGLIVGAFAIGGLKHAIDGFTQLQARVGLIEDSLQSARTAFSGLFAIAQKSGQDVGSVADVYARIGRNARQLGLDQQAALETTQAVANAVKLSGASAASAQAALVQFGQALASGTLRGDELNSVMEQTPALAEAIARGMGKTVGELRKLGEEGKLTAQDVIGAIRNESARLEAEASRMGDTIGMSLTRLSNAWQKFIGENTQGAAQGLASAISTLAENIDRAAAAALALGAGLTAAKFAGWIQGAGGLVAALTRINPVTAGIGLAVTALGIAFQDWQRKGEAAADGVRDALEKLRSAAARVSSDLRGMSGENVRKSLADIERQRDAEAKRIEAMRNELAGIETRKTDATGRVTGYDADAIRRRDALQAQIAGAEMALAGLNKELDGIRANMKQAGTRDIEAYFDKFGSKANEAKKHLDDLKTATDKALAAARARVNAGDAGPDEIKRIEENYKAKRAEIIKSMMGDVRIPHLVDTFDAGLAAMRANLKTAEDMLDSSLRARLVKEEAYW
ncbi:MAG: tape measure protein, partial [Rhodocyclaceae bacterium]|nr:tape measure protein [Rhodocyclaceae bacterium]